MKIDIFEVMKRYLYILAFLPTLMVAQYDFENRYFTIGEESLPEISAFDVILNDKPSFKKVSFQDYGKVTVSNYYQPVDMMTALQVESNLLTSPGIDIPALNQKEFGFSFSVNGNNSRDGTINYNTSNTGLRNTVYREARSVYFCAPTTNFFVPRSNQ